MGVKGRIKGVKAGASIIVGGIKHPIQVWKTGEYWRLLVPGTYNFTVEAPGLEPFSFPKVKIKSSKTPVILNHTFV
jgi:carboxypeptidase D